MSGMTEDGKAKLTMVSKDGIIVPEEAAAPKCTHNDVARRAAAALRQFNYRCKDVVGPGPKDTCNTKVHLRILQFALVEDENLAEFEKQMEALAQAQIAEQKRRAAGIILPGE